jgi:hypothetical protein
VVVEVKELKNDETEVDQSEGTPEPGPPPEESDEAEINQFELLMASGAVVTVFDSDELDKVQKRLNRALVGKGGPFVRFPGEGVLSMSDEEGEDDFELPAHVVRADLVVDVSYNPDRQILEDLLRALEERDEVQKIHQQPEIKLGRPPEKKEGVLPALPPGLG